MTASKKTRESVIEELLAGREVCAAIYANRIGVDASGVREVLRELSEHLVVCRTEKTGRRGGSLVYYAARDTEALTARLDGLHGSFFGAEAPTKARFDELLKAWGIAPRRLNLPTTVHRVATKEDGPEPILV